MSDATFIDGDGKVKVRVSISGGDIPPPAPGSITTAELADNSVTTAKIAALAVGNGDIADSAITNTKLSNSSVTLSKLGSDATTALNGKLTATKMPAIANSTATDVAGVVADHNALLAAMRTAGMLTP